MLTSIAMKYISSRTVKQGPLAGFLSFRLYPTHVRPCRRISTAVKLVNTALIVQSQRKDNVQKMAYAFRLDSSGEIATGLKFVLAFRVIFSSQSAAGIALSTTLQPR